MRLPSPSLCLRGPDDVVRVNVEDPCLPPFTEEETGEPLGAGRVRFTISEDMSLSRLLAPILCLLACAGTCAPAAAQSAARGRTTAPDSADAARAAAEKWLQQVDSSAWRAAREAASALLADSLSEEEWRARGRRVRNRLGHLRSRRLTRAQLRRQIERVSSGGPFVLLRFQSEFAAGLYVETVLTVWSEEGWKVAGYEVAPVSEEAPRDRPNSENGPEN